jgi:NitT/TauT family transport system permease protein
MSRIGLFLLQMLVAIAVVALWQFFASVPVFGKVWLPPFFFSNPVDVFSQVIKWFYTGVIWTHLAITLWESILAFVIGSLGVTLMFFIVFFNVYQGVKEVSQTVLNNGRMLGMSERQLMAHVYWPSALSWMFSSLHTSVGFAVVGAVVGEYLGSAAGLGYLIQQAEGVFDVAGVFAGMFVLSIFVILIDVAVTLVERRLLVWRPAAADGRG